MGGFSYQVVRDKRFIGDEEIIIRKISTNCYTGYYFQKDSEGWYTLSAKSGWLMIGLSSHDMIELAEYMQKLNEEKQCT